MDEVTKKVGRPKGAIPSEPTPRQRKAFEIYVKSLAANDNKSFKKILMEAGYSLQTASYGSSSIKHSPGWTMLKKTLDTTGAHDAFNELVSSKNEDKRTRLASAIEITRITGGYPDQQNKVVGFFSNLDSLRRKDDDDVIRQETSPDENQLLSAPGAE